MSQPTYTDADVEIAAKAIWISCGTPTKKPSSGCYDDARSVLDALDAAGRLKAEKAPPVSTDGPCMVVGCSGGRFARGYCTTHYGRLRRTGDPLGREPQDDRTATAVARKAFHERWERQVDPEGALKPEERARRAAEAKSAYYSALAGRRRSTRPTAAEVKP